MKCTAFWILSLLCFDCDTTTAHRTSDFDFRGHEMGDSFSEFLASVKNTKGVVSAGSDNYRCNKVGLLADGSATRHDDVHAVIRVSVSSLHYRDAIGRIQWHFPCISNATAFAKAKEKLGEPSRARFCHKPRETKTYYWTRSDGGSCHLILRESSDGLLNVFRREADAEEIDMIGGDI